ncbi:MAG: family 78 glycoside hydrolase catalytic domain, partial [Bacteroidota bacterium]
MKILLLVYILFSCALYSISVNIHNLRCEYLSNPFGIDIVNPRLSWIIESSRRGERQTAFQILVASSSDKLSQNIGDLWDSHKVKSGQTTQLEYSGKPLVSGIQCYWKVRIWDMNGKVSDWSKPALWTMGLIDAKDWQGKWIGVNEPSPAEWPKPRYLRKSFTLDGNVRRATVYVTSLGLYELRLNGKRVGNLMLTPEWTNYNKRILYQTYDVTNIVHTGSNAIAAILGNGWYCGGWQHWKDKLKAIYGTEPLLLTQLKIEFADGGSQTIVTDESWKGTADGPLQFAGIYEGVTYDARKDMNGWDSPEFSDLNWTPVTTPRAGIDFKVGKLVGQRGEPIRVTQELKPIAITEPKPGVYVFTCDQNMVGWCRFKFHHKAGETIELQHGEMLNPDGTVFLGNLTVVSKHRIQLDSYTFKSNEEETFEPNFTYHGFQYVEVRGLKVKPDIESLTGVVFNSDCPEVGQFTCSEPLLNRLAKNILWSQRGNYMGVPTDCPQRNERCGYTGDAQFFMRAAVYNMDVSAFFSR